MSSSTNNKKPYCPYCGCRIEKLYSPETVAEMLECSVLKVRKMVWRGEIGHRRIGRLVRIPRSELETIGEYHPPVSQLVKKKTPER